MASKKKRIWTHRTGEFVLGERTLIMGVLNVTPDSFSDGGKFVSVENAVEHALQMLKAGADIIDIGAESTRPGSKPVTDKYQIERLVPVLRELRGKLEIPISIDTTSATVAEACIDAGASIVNDISGFRKDERLAAVCAKTNCGVVLMHMKGTPETMQQDTEYDNLILDVAAFFRASSDIAIKAGVKRESIIVDPGIGFGKTFDQNYRLMASLKEFRGIAQGVMAGTSRKAFTGEFSGLPADQRQYSTAATIAISILNGADIVRVHDVSEMKQVADICDRYRKIICEDS